MTSVYYQVCIEQEGKKQEEKIYAQLLKQNNLQQPIAVSQKLSH
jgi:hypothetical protein